MKDKNGLLRLSRLLFIVIIASLLGKGIHLITGNNTLYKIIASVCVTALFLFAWVKLSRKQAQ